MNQARYAIYVVAKYLDTSTINKNSKFHKTTLPHYMIFTIEYSSASDNQVEVLSIYYNILYRACLGSLIHLLYKILDLFFTVHKLETISSNPGKV